MVTADFEERLARFGTFEPGWDGERAEPISQAVLDRARQLANETIGLAPEPYVGPAADGSVLLMWHLPNGVDIDYYIEPDEDSEDAVVTRGERVYEVHVDGQAAVPALLRKEADV